jgi:hypothetical protein
MQFMKLFKISGFIVSQSSISAAHVMFTDVCCFPLHTGMALLLLRFASHTVAREPICFQADAPAPWLLGHHGCHLSNVASLVISMLLHARVV